MSYGRFLIIKTLIRSDFIVRLNIKIKYKLNKKRKRDEKII